MKHSKQNIWKIARLIALGALVASPLAASPWGRGGDDDCREHRPMARHDKHFGGDHMGDMGLHLIQMGKKLDLTDEQETQILALSQKYRAEIQSNWEVCQAAREKMATLRDADSFDETAIRVAMDEAYPSMVEGIVLHAKYRSELGKILTDDQKAKLEKVRDRMHKRFDHWKEGKGDGEGPDGQGRKWRKPDID